MKLRYNSLFWLTILFTLVTNNDKYLLAQNPDSTALEILYDDFASTVRARNGAAHLALYVHPLSPIHVILENNNGPYITGVQNATEWVDDFTGWANNLTITNIEFEIHDGIASSVADYHGYGTGLDLFGYVRTTAGWRLLLLHSTGDPINGNYSLLNSIDDVLDDLNTTVTEANKDVYLGLFANSSSPFLTFETNFDENFSFDSHSIGAYFETVNSPDDNISIELSNADIRIEDAYTARVWTDYQVTINNQTQESGKALLFMFATRQKGWQVSAFVGYQEEITGLNTPISIPKNLSLQQNYPNPFNPTTDISYSLKQSGQVKLQIFNTLGQPIRDLIDHQKSAVKHSITWDARDNNGKEVSSGIYIYRITDKNQTLSKRMLLLK